MHVIIPVIIVAALAWWAPDFLNFLKWCFLLPFLGLIFGGFIWCVSGLMGLPTHTFTFTSFGLHCIVGCFVWFLILR